MTKRRNYNIASVKTANKAFNIKICSFVGHPRRIRIWLLEGCELLLVEVLRLSGLIIRTNSHGAKTMRGFRAHAQQTLVIEEALRTTTTRAVDVSTAVKPAAEEDDKHGRSADRACRCALRRSFKIGHAAPERGDCLLGYCQG